MAHNDSLMKSDVDFTYTEPVSAANVHHSIYSPTETNCE